MSLKRSQLICLSKALPRRLRNEDAAKHETKYGDFVADVGQVQTVLLVGCQQCSQIRVVHEDPSCGRCSHLKFDSQIGLDRVPETVAAISAAVGDADCRRRCGGEIHAGVEDQVVLVERRADRGEIVAAGEVEG